MILERQVRIIILYLIIHDFNKTLKLHQLGRRKLLPVSIADGEYHSKFLALLSLNIEVTMLIIR